MAEKMRERLTGCSALPLTGTKYSCAVTVSSEEMLPAISESCFEGSLALL